MVATPDFPTMSAAQVAIVQGHWGKVKDQGVEVLYNFLHMFPQNQPVFKAFAGKDLEALKCKSTITYDASFDLIEIYCFSFPRLRSSCNKDHVRSN